MPVLSRKCLCYDVNRLRCACAMAEMLGDLPGVSEFGVPALAFQNKSLTLSIIESGLSSLQPRFKKSCSGKLKHNNKT